MNAEQSMGINDDKAAESPPASSPKAAQTAGGVTAPGGSRPPLLKLDPNWGPSPEYPNWVAICAVEWDGGYFSLSGHIGVERGRYCVNAINAHEKLMAALESALEYFEDREDVVDGDYGEPAPNKEMALAQELRAALENAHG